MSTLSGLKFMPSYLKVETDIFPEIEAEIACALRTIHGSDRGDQLGLLRQSGEKILSLRGLEC